MALEENCGMSPQELAGEEGQPLVLTNRDIAVFRMIHEHRYSPYNQIQTAFWRDRSVQSNSCYGRIERLVKEGYLEKGFSKRKGLHVYFLCESGRKELRDRGLDSDLPLYHKTDDFDRYADHDLKVLSIRLLLAQLGLDQWRSERLLKERDFLNRVPDGILSVKGYKIAIEMENFLKSGLRYEELFAYYGENTDYALLFMVMDTGLKDWLLKMNYDVKRVWFASYNDLIKLKGETLFENKSASFLLNRFL
jgi:DNA-binding PadR family transcriptional regulator